MRLLALYICSMRRCAICQETSDHPSFQVKEMQHCLLDWFEYFQCNNCKCIQIAVIPENISRYYPSDYYSFSDSLGNELLEKRADFFHREQAAHLTDKKKSFFGSLFSIGYRPPALFEWLRLFSIARQDRILDIAR